MNNAQKMNGHHRRCGLGLAAILIVAGLLLFARRLGGVDEFFNVVISWQMLFIGIGIWSLVEKRYYRGFVMIGIGLFFMILLFLEIGIGTYWPLLLVTAGILIIVNMFRRGPDNRAHLETLCSKNASGGTEDGFVASNNLFGGVRQIVFDPVFRGANLKTTLGGTVLDLRHTALQDAETYIDVDCLLGGIEIYVPYRWLVITEIQPVLGGCEDKRFGTDGGTDPDHKLVIRGRVTLGGVEIKN